MWGLHRLETGGGGVPLPISNALCPYGSCLSSFDSDGGNQFKVENDVYDLRPESLALDAEVSCAPPQLSTY